MIVVPHRARPLVLVVRVEVREEFPRAYSMLVAVFVVRVSVGQVVRVDAVQVHGSRGVVEGVLPRIDLRRDDHT
jgi:hypothetical protein